MIYGEDKNLLKSFVSGGFAEVNSEKCIILAESVDDISHLDKSLINKEIQHLEKLEDLKSKDKLNIAFAKLEAIDSLSIKRFKQTNH